MFIRVLFDYEDYDDVWAQEHRASVTVPHNSSTLNLHWNKLRADQVGKVILQLGTLKRSCLIGCLAPLLRLVKVLEGILKDP